MRVLHAQTGRGPTFAKTTISGDLVVCVLADTLTVGERTLVENGQAQSVLDTRKLYQKAMRPDLTAAVETHTGRKVIAFMSDNHIDPDTADRGVHPRATTRRRRLNAAPAQPACGRRGRHRSSSVARPAAEHDRRGPAAASPHAASPQRRPGDPAVGRSSYTGSAQSASIRIGRPK